MTPKIDSELGLSVYSTNFPGTKGKIKQNNEDFEVNEVISEKALNAISEDNGFAVYILRKSGTDTTHVLRDVEYNIFLNSNLEILEITGEIRLYLASQKFFQA